jgi:uncharacterized protein (TIGR03437 family)
LTSNGDGTFRTAQSFGQYTLASLVSGGISWVAAGDFKGDGKPGLVGPAGDGLQLSILINETPGSDASANAVSAADYSPSVAPGSIASLFGSGLASGAGQATGPPWPASLANTSVRVLDAKGVERLAGLLYVSPTQINFVIPPEAAYGFAIFNVAGAQTLPDGARSTIVQQLTPAFFTLSGTGQGPPAATAVRVESLRNRLSASPGRELWQLCIERKPGGDVRWLAVHNSWIGPTEPPVAGGPSERNCNNTMPIHVFAFPNTYGANNLLWLSEF